MPTMTFEKKTFVSFFSKFCKRVGGLKCDATFPYYVFPNWPTGWVGKAQFETFPKI